MLTYNDIRESQLNTLAESFIQQCLDFLRQTCIDKEELIRTAKTIEDCLFGREYYHDDGIYVTEGVHDVTDLWFISESWWNRYDNLDSYVDRVYVMGFIKDVFPDTWRP